MPLMPSCRGIKCPPTRPITRVKAQHNLTVHMPGLKREENPQLGYGRVRRYVGVSGTCSAWLDSHIVSGSEWERNRTTTPDLQSGRGVEGKVT